MVQIDDETQLFTTVLVVDDEPIFRRGVRGVLEAFAPRIALVGEAGCAEDAVTAVQDLVPDVVLFDLRLPPRRGVGAPGWKNGVRAITQMVRLAPSTRILVLSYLEESDALFAALGAGATGYIAKSDAFDGRDLVAAIEQLRKGETIYGPLIAQRIREYYQREHEPGEPGETLTPREREVLDLLIQRRTNREIAETLVISVKTVKTHVSNILTKFQIRRREEIPWLTSQSPHDRESA
jgi:NarL family two-component system response regulator LiaR